MSGIEDIASRIVAEVKPYTMAPPESVATTVRLALETFEENRNGDFVECGTWMGGSSFAMLLAQRYKFGRILKPVWMLDSFQGLPPADDRDGPLALQYQRAVDAPHYFDNCTAPLPQVREAIRQFGFTDSEAIVVPGWFNDSIPVHRDELSRRGIALLRIDCDWYEPVHYVLTELTPFVVDEGAIILDDYYAWDGCARATHDFLSQNDFSWRIRSMEKFYGAWMIKRSHRVAAL
ncbi:TylF/MycF/NovP-related O-methyltransferase [Microvirga sp. 2MCAF38]|uniref:TylF/MycF/NovP-related O-methyltransferase n=1 Tax=Microvirga sp. 2MCAF38 TaxID=3232989 RepID=UPI003F98F48E